MCSYVLLEAEEILKETETAFLLLFTDGEQAWLLKEEVLNVTHYSVGDRNVTLHLREGNDHDKNTGSRVGVV